MPSSPPMPSLRLSFSSSSAPMSAPCNLLCPEDAYNVACWDADTSTPMPPVCCYHSLPDTDDCSISAVLNAELPHMPQSDYLQRFQDRSLDVTARQDAVSWIYKVHEYYRFSPVTAYLSVTYLDRFLSSHTLPRGNGWPFQLLAVACLSIAAKMEETEVPMLLDFQLFEPLFVFRPSTIGRMELLVMSCLQWRMRSVTPFDFVDFFARKLSTFGSPHALCSYRFFSRISDLILRTHRVIDFLGFRPSTIAAAAVICAARETGDCLGGVGTNTAIFSYGVDQEMVGRCQQLMEEYIVDTCPSGAKVQEEAAQHSPVGVLDAAACGNCSSQKSECDAAGASRPVEDWLIAVRCTDSSGRDDRNKSHL